MLGPFDFSGWAVLVHVAALTQVVGYLFRDQLALRTMLLVGTLLYIAYYWLYPEVPLWDAIFWGAMLALANLVVTARLALDRTRFGLDHERRRLLVAFDPMTPGHFRRLMRIGAIADVAEGAVLTREGVEPERLFYVFEGSVTVAKGARRFEVPAPLFIGELGFLERAPASATVTAGPGTRLVAWQSAPLRRLTARTPLLGIALQGLFNRDMAVKVRRS